MKDIQRQRRNAHYGKSTQEPDQKRDYIKIFIQLLVCMAIIAGALYGNGYRLPQGETIGEFTRHAFSHTIDITLPFNRLRAFVAEKIGPVVLPDPIDAEVFNETTPTKSTE